MTSCLLTWRTKSSQNRIYVLRICFDGSKLFLYEFTPDEMRDKNEIASPESVPVYLKLRSINTKGRQCSMMTAHWWYHVCVLALYSV